jgi:hypothetical protein
MLNAEGPILYPLEWPACWLFEIRGDIGVDPRKPVAETRYNLGELTTIERGGAITYRCRCGAKFTRAPGFQNQEAGAWVIRHIGHVSS